MKKLLLVIVSGIVLMSCGGSKSGKRLAKNGDSTYIASLRDDEDRNVPFRAHATWISTATFDRIVDNKIEIVYTDSAFRAGDTVLVDTETYILQERVK
jgi:hypothetical protein